MPDALELPWVRAAVVPRMRPRDAVVAELVPNGRPGLAAVVGARKHLPEPATALGRINPIRIGGRSLHVIDLPAREVWARDGPIFSLAIRGENECAFLRADQHAYAAHPVLQIGGDEEYPPITA